MNYTRIYASIVLRAQSERTERLALKKQGQYFEDHHIVPRSLGGKDTIDNMALLTGREHFICHWLLVKIYQNDIDAHDKMLMALWMMQNTNGYHTDRYINSRAYESLRIDFANAIRKTMSAYQCGDRNSQYGTHWYTNCYTGECCKSSEQLTYPWYKGRWLFRGESRKLIYWSTGHNYKLDVSHRNQVTRTRKNSKGEHYKQRSNLELKQSTIIKAHDWWDKFHAGNYNNLEEFGRIVEKSYGTVYYIFNKYIPAFSKNRTSHRVRFCSNIDLVGHYD